jgi:starvation-inducible outer membrane lipoprotein
MRSAVVGYLMSISLCLICLGCSAGLPSKYVHQAEPGVTLTALATHPEEYQGKVVILGGVIVEDKQDGDRLWLRLRNRPLDEDYHPHRPPELTGPEAGHYWVVADPEKIPSNYRSWARVTVVGQVSDIKPIALRSDPLDEPVLAAMYMRGWGGTAGTGHTWEEFEDPSYRFRTPRGIHGEFGPQY